MNRHQTTRPLSRVAALALVLLLCVTGCSTLNAEKIPVSAGVKDGYDVTVMFPDALNLADGAAVKIDGATVGRVEAISTEDFQAKVRLAIQGDTKLPEGTVFRLRPTTALGELFVEIIRGDGGGHISPGSVVPVDDTRTAPTVEDGLAAASLLINGGSLGQIKTIVNEVNTTLDGRTGTVRDFINGTNRLLGTLNRNKTDIGTLLEALADVSKQLDSREDKINEAIRLAGPVAKVLRRNSGDVTALLTRLARMTKKVDGLVGMTGADLKTMLTELGPVLDSLQNSKGVAKSTLIKATDLTGKLDRAVPTDYLNLMLVLRLSGDFGLPGLGLGASR